MITEEGTTFMQIGAIASASRLHPYSRGVLHESAPGRDFLIEAEEVQPGTVQFRIREGGSFQNLPTFYAQKLSHLKPTPLYQHGHFALLKPNLCVAPFGVWTSV
jgi:hypothetical protein